MKNVVVKSSEIQGKGVYAIVDIQKSETVLEIDDSHVVTDPSKLTKEQNEYDCDYLEDGKVILMQSPEKFINHSCDPSTYVKTISGVRKVLAMRDIKIGDEITYDYSINGDNDGTFTCHCGSKICRGLYQGNFFKLTKDVQLKYLPYLDDWFIVGHQNEMENLGILVRNIVATIVLNSKDMFIILKRSSSKKVHASIWNLPSGGVEKNESLSDASIREVFEETGIKIKEAVFGVNLLVKVNDNLILNINYMLAETDQIGVRLNSENTEFKWVTPKESLEYGFAISRTEVENVLNSFKLL